MFKKFLLAALMMIGVGCNEVTAPEPEIKTQNIQKIVISDTVLIKKKIISGKVIEKNSSGKNVGGLSAIVCSDLNKTCVQTNDEGEYYINFESPIQKISARSLKNSDTTFDTIPNKKIDSIVDTIAKIDKIDSTKKDTVKITYHKFVPQREKDTVVVFKDSKKIYETQITSWVNILPVDYVVQRNISGKIVQNIFAKELKIVEAVFWSLDSNALTIPLEINGQYYSGFVYQHYNDSSFKNAVRMYNLFVRVLDTSDSVYGLTNVMNYSERAGDLVFEDIIPGNVARYPKPNYFRVIKDGDNISILVDSVQKISLKKNWYALDSLFYRSFTEYIPEDVYKFDESCLRWKHDTIVMNVIKNEVDSFGVYFESDSNLTTTFDAGRSIKIDVKIGQNFITFPKGYQADFSSKESQIYFYSNKIKNLKIYVWLK